MKRILSIIVLFFALLLGCDDSETIISSDVSISKDMQMFLYLITGDEKDINQAMSIYAANDNLENHNICYYNLKSPHVIEKDNDTYIVNFKAGFTTRQYCFEWSDDKITEIKDKGIQ